MLLFETASRHMQWLSQRQAVTAENIANADTPAYRGKDIAPFEDALRQTELTLAMTSPRHMAPDAASPAAYAVRAQRPWDRALSGNDVALEQELLKAGETSRMMAFDTGVVRSFHRMILSSLKV